MPTGTQRVISFLRQIVEHGGFYRTSDQSWVTMERIQFVGACNPPTDPGRKPLSHRFVERFSFSPLPPSLTYLPTVFLVHPPILHPPPSFSPFSILCLSFPPFIPLPLRHVSFSSSFLPFPYFRLSPFHLNFFFHPFFFLSLFYFMFVISTLYSCAPPSSFHLLLLLCFQNLFLFLHSNSPPTLSSLCLL